MWRGVVLAVAFSTGLVSASTPNDPPDFSRLLDRYASGDYDAAVAAAAKAEQGAADVRRRLERQGDAWIAREPYDALRRRLIVATYSLELINATVDTEWRTFESLIERHCNFLRRAPVASPSERTWYLAAVALQGRAQDQTRAPGSHLDHAERRFPDEPRFQIARAARAAFTVDGAPGSRVDDSVARFATLLTLPAVQAEAEVHIGHLWLGAKKPADALDHAQKAIQFASEPGVMYLARTLAGRALEKLDDPEGAIREYRLALAAIPGAQSATTTLAALLFSRDRPGEGAELVEESLRLHATDDDPWRLYDYGEYWRYRDLIAQLHKELR